MTREFDWFKRTFGFKAEKDFDVENSIEKDLDKELDWVKNARERGEKKYKTLKDKDAFDEIKGFSYAVGTRINVDAPKPDWSKRFPNTPAFYSIDPAEYPTKPFSFNIDQSEYANSPIGGIEKEIRREITKEVKDAVKRGGDIKYGKPFEVGDVVRMTKEELNKLLDEFGGYWHGWEEASSNEDRLSCQKGMQEVSEILWTCINASQFAPASMPESFDDLVKMHGKDVIRDWLKAMLA